MFGNDDDDGSSTERKRKVPLDALSPKAKEAMQKMAKEAKRYRQEG